MANISGDNGSYLADFAVVNLRRFGILYYRVTET
jgi:hypothetical protein